MDEFEKLYLKSRLACSNERNFQLLFQHSLSNLLCLGRHTITGLICTRGFQFNDWRREYQFYSQNKFNADKIFEQVRLDICQRQSISDPLVVAMDDSILRKTGTKIPGVAYRKDPLGPKFHINLVRGQRVLQISAAVPSENCSARMIPIDFIHAPSVKKPHRKATSEELDQFKEMKKQQNLSLQGLGRLTKLRSDMPKEKALWVSVDGSYTNRTVLKGLPQDTVLIGRIRSDAKLNFLPDSINHFGRKKVYGEDAPTPEELRKNDNIPYKTIKAYAAGKDHDFKYKTFDAVRWRAAGEKYTLRVIVIAPLGYRLTKNGKTLYRNPAYLICTDPSIPIEKIIQAYLWRWDIEVNNRDEKNNLGLGQAQVRNKKSVDQTMKLSVASYACLLMASINAFGTKDLPPMLPLPKWRDNNKKKRPSLHDLITMLRHEVWASSIINTSFSGFADKQHSNQKSEKVNFPLFDALFYSTGA